MKALPLRILLACLCVMVVAGSAFGQDDAKKKKKKKVKPDVILHTNYGDISVILYEDTPLHRANFLKLCKEGFYDGTQFHRIIKEFMIQGGDPLSKDEATAHKAGTGGPGYTIPAEIHDHYIHSKGKLAAARQGDQVNPKRESSGSQFYIVQGKVWTDAEMEQIERRMATSLQIPDFRYTDEQRTAYTTLGGAPWLDRQYTVFGEVVEGMDVIDKIAVVETQYGDRPKEPIIVESVKVKAKVPKEKE